MKENLINYILENFNNKEEISEEAILLIEKKIDSYIEIHGVDEDLLIHEALILLTPPVCDYIKSIELLKNIKTLRTIILIASIQLNNEGFIENKIIDFLLKTSNCTSFEKSMVNYMLAINSSKNDIDYEKFLISSINENDKTVLSYLKLSNYYLSKKDKNKSLEFLEKGLNNVIKIFEINDTYDYSSYDYYVNEYITGNYMSKILYDNYKKQF